MATTRRNSTHFSANINGIEVSFVCYTTSTRYGFCHTAHCLSHDMTDTKVSCNRTWETFTYETVLSRAIDKLPKSLQEGAREQIIIGGKKKEEERADAMFNSFKKLHDGLTPENKERLANSGIEIHSEDDARAVMGLMGLMTLMQ